MKRTNNILQGYRDCCRSIWNHSLRRGGAHLRLFMETCHPETCHPSAASGWLRREIIAGMH